MNLLFVYGSLKSGLSNHGRLGGAPCVDAGASSPGHTLVSYVAGYPALIPYAGRAARGEVYSVSAAVLAELDEFEECPLVYVRRVIEVTLRDGGRVSAFAYLAAEQGDYELYPSDWWEPSPGLLPFEER